MTKIIYLPIKHSPFAKYDYLDRKALKQAQEGWDNKESLFYRYKKAKLIKRQDCFKISEDKVCSIYEFELEQKEVK